MSIYAMANRVIEDQRRRRVQAPGGLLGAGVATKAAPAAAPAPSAQEKALSAIVTYIPTEIIGGYVAIAALFTQSKDPTQVDLVIQFGVFVFFVLLTPVIIWLAVSTKLKSDGQSIPWALVHWPWWPMIAGTVAFVVWVAALPGSLATRIAWFEPYMGALGVLLLALVLAVGDGVSSLRSNTSAPAGGTA
jgi:hypothetical protein